MRGLVLMVGGLVGLVPPAVPAQGHVVEAATAVNFRWSGECQIRCANGRCQSYCNTGIVFALDAFDAKLKAEGEIRARASSQGTVVEGTVRVTVDLFNFEGQVEAATHRPINGGVLLATMASTQPYQAICENLGCRWVGRSQADLYQALVDARDHYTQTGHRVRIDGLPARLPFAADGLREEMGQVSKVGLADPMAQIRYPAHFSYRFEAYDRNGRWVDSTNWETDAQNPVQLQQLMANAEAGFAQRMRDRGIEWSRISPILLNVRPL